MPSSMITHRQRMAVAVHQAREPHAKLTANNVAATLAAAPLQHVVSDFVVRSPRSNLTQSLASSSTVVPT